MRRALLIGSEIGGLRGVHRDVAVMDELLQGHGFTTVRATGPDATASGIVTQLRDLVAATAADDATVVYYSGHGSRVPSPVPGPRWLQCIVPTDVEDRSGGTARVVLAEELSRVQLDLTARTPNVTTILDCCHAARMSRDPELIPRALDVAGLPMADLERRLRAPQDGPRRTTHGVDANPDAVRVVACAVDEVAYERYSDLLDGRHGVLTAALATVLARTDSPMMTWNDVLAAVRGALGGRVWQRPEVEGPADRVVFSTDRRAAVGVRPVRLDGGSVLLDGATLFGIVPGDRYALVTPGAGDEITAVVERIVDGRALLRLDPPGATPVPGARAWPRDVALGACAVAVVPADHPRRAEIVTALERTARVSVVDDPGAALATVRLDGTGVQVLDAAGALSETAVTRSPDGVAADVRRLARAVHVRDLGSGTGTEELPDDVTVSWVRLPPGGDEEPLGPGEHVFDGDLLLARLTNTGGERRFVSVVDVGLAGAVTLLTTAEGGGTTLSPGETYELGRDWFAAAGMPMVWPSGLPRLGPRTESLLVIVADGPIDGLQALEQDGVTHRGASGRSTLGTLLTRAATGRRDVTRPPDPDVPPLRYRVHRLDVVVHPIPRPVAAAEPPFAVDERPDPSFRLVAPDTAPEPVTVHLTDMIAAGDAPRRVDVLAVTGGPAPAFRATTARLPAADLLVHDGPAERYLDLAVWVSPADSPVPGLADLLADRAADLADTPDDAVAALLRIAADGLGGTGVYRTSLLPQRRFHAGSGVVGAAGVAFTVKVTGPDADEPGDGEPVSAAWRLAEEFDGRARDTAEPDPDLLGELADEADEDVLLSLVGELAALCHGEDRAAGDRYAEHLLALGSRLGEDGERGMRAAVDVTTAELYLRTGDRSEARRRVERCADDLADVLPGLLADREFVLGWLAEEDGRPAAEVRAHATAARDGFAEYERWEEAAFAAEAAASTYAVLNRVALDDVGRAAQLYAQAGRPEDARRCVEEAGQRVAQALNDVADSPEGPSLCAAARALAQAHGLTELAARLGLAEAVCTSGPDVPWPQVVARHERSRAELAALDVGAGELARVDLSLARAAVAHGEAAEAHRLLEAALPALRASGLDGDAQLCEAMLLTIDTARDPASAQAMPLADDRFTDPDVRAMMLMTEGLRLAAHGSTEEALARLREVSAIDGGTSGPLRAVMTDAAAALVRANAGDRSGVPGALATIDAQLADPALPPPARAMLAQLAGMLRAPAAAPAAAPPRIEDMDAELARLRGLPAGRERAEGAAAAVRALVLGGDPMADARVLRPLDELLPMTEGMPETSEWVRIRAGGRLMSIMRATAERELPDPDQVIPRIDAIAEEVGDDPTLAPLIEAARWSVRVGQSVQHGDAGALTGLPQEMKEMMDRLPQGDPRLEQLRAALDPLMSLADTDAFERDPAALLDRLKEAAAGLPGSDLRTILEHSAATLSAVLPGQPADDTRLRALQAEAERTDLPDEERALTHTAVATAALGGMQEADPGRIALALDHLRQALEIVGTRSPQRVFHLSGLAMGLFRRYELTGATADAREARTLLLEAKDLAAGPGHPQWQMINEMLAEVGRTLGESAGDHLIAVDGLRGHVWRVLAARDLRGATAAVRQAGVDAVDVARRCLIANDPAAAITALDAGRGLALFAATTVGTFAKRLAEAGDADLLARWEKACDADDPAELPSDLRRAVLRAVTRDGAASDLLDPPAYAEIQRALLALDADVLVYLVAGDGPVPGYAVCAPATGAPRYLPLPNLTAGAEDVARYLGAVQRRDLTALNRPAPNAAAPERAEAVDRLCGWAWEAAMGPLIERMLPRLDPPPGGRVPRLVLVPMGDLARVPWQAARHPDGGRYALERVAVSQAPSARMLCRSAALAPVPSSTGGLIVADPAASGDVPALVAARREALAIRDAFHLGARYVGRRPNGTQSPTGAGTAEEVRAWFASDDIAAGTTAHLACHGVVEAGGAAPTAYLLLAGDDRLPAEELIALLERHPDRAVGLVVLAACHSGVSMTGFDEAYSLGTAFLAGGVRSVLSSQWAVEDEATAALMFMVHHYVTARGLPAWAALREAQRWMLDAHRIVPDTMPGPLRERLDPDRLPTVDAWAAFVHSGR